MKTLNKEQKGEALILLETLMYSLFPIIVAHSTKILPPILFAGLSTITASVTLLLWLIYKKQLPTLLHKETIKYSLGVTLFIIILPSIFIFTGASQTSGINTTILLQTEILFTFLIYSFLKLEKITPKKILGSIIVFCGTTAIVYNGKLQINLGDLLIIAGTLFYPFGNYFAKRALQTAPPSTILFIRSLLGGLTLIFISLLFEGPISDSKPQLLKYWPLFIVNGIFIYHFSKILWYEGIKRIDISKAIPMSTGGYPAFSLIFAIIFLHEIPSVYQWVGFTLIIAGIFVLIKKDKIIAPVGSD